MLINKTKYTPSQVKSIIDFNLQESKSFMFVCDFSLAHYIYDYLHNDYGIVATALELSTDIDEYFVSLQFYDNGDMDFVCEFSKGEDDDYKYDESDDINYYVFTDMAFGDVREYLTGKGELDFCELVDEDCVDELLEGEEHYQNCQCVSCKSARGEFTADEEYEIGLVEHYAGYIENSECECGSMLRNILYSMLQECMSMGYENAREEMRDFLED